VRRHWRAQQRDVSIPEGGRGDTGRGLRDVLVLDEVMGSIDVITISNRTIGVSSSIGGVFIYSLSMLPHCRRAPPYRATCSCWTR